MADQPPPNVVLMRHDMQAMLSFIQGSRIVRMARETAVSHLQAWLLSRYWWSLVTTVAALGLILLLDTLWPAIVPTSGFLCGIVLLLFVARIGALISIGRRIKSDDVDESVGADAIYALASLGSGINGLAIALMSSNAFGLVMYALFASGLPSAIGLSGGIAPTFRLSVGELHTRMLVDQAKVADLLVALNACSTNATGTGRAKAPAAKATPSPTARPADADGSATVATITANSVGADTAVGASHPLALESANPAIAAAPPSAPPPKPTASTTPPNCADRKQALDTATHVASVSNDAFLAALVLPPDKRGAGGNAVPDTILTSLQYGLGLAEVSDLFKMLIWAFIAGFFETLVPDMLDALAKRGKENKEKG